MNVYLYCLAGEYVYQTDILNRKFENRWMKLTLGGMLYIRANYAWDGCSPKWKIGDMYFGTPEGVLNSQTFRSKTYYGSLVHDALCQFQSEIKPFIPRKPIDKEFKKILIRDKFGSAKLYYRFVRMFAKLIHIKRKENKNGK